VENVSWDDAHAFLRMLNEWKDGKDYHLPTEGQWEYACRANTASPRYHHNVDVIAWYNSNSNYQTHPVGQKLPNAWGLYDMQSNVSEWCHIGLQKYMAGAMVDPMDRIGVNIKNVFRGGAWGHPSQLVRAAYRSFAVLGFRNGDLGCRCACSA
jgi:formylglycine-generating enzyme required for sulfatase activity